MSDSISLASKIAKISNEIGAIAKTGKNKEQGYQFIEYGNVALKIRELFDKYSVAMIPEVVEYTTEQIISAKGRGGYHYVLRMKFTIMNGDDKDDKIEANWLGEGTDYGDKGVNKAETSATKYFLMRLLNISEKSEVEADSESLEYVAAISPTQNQLNYLADLCRKQGIDEDKISARLAMIKTADEASLAIEKMKGNS